MSPLVSPHPLGPPQYGALWACDFCVPVPVTVSVSVCVSVQAVDLGRVNLGIARGSEKKVTYLQLVNSKLDALLAWKNRRTPLEEAA